MSYYDDYTEKKNYTKILAVIAVILVVVLAAISINIKTVSVRGNETYSAEEIVRILFPDKKSKNTCYFLVNKFAGTKKNVPFIADYDIRLKSPTQAEVVVYEKKPVGCILYMSQYMYFDKDGIVIESSDEKLSDVPLVKGIKSGNIVMGKKLLPEDETVFSKIMNISQQLSSYSISCELISFDDSGNISIKLKDEDISVNLGDDDYLAVKLSALNDMLPEIKERNLKGNLNLSNYNDKEKGGMSSFKLSK